MTVTVLVIDDDQDILNFVSSILKQDGYHVDTAINGDDALKMIKKKNYSMVISDVVMPGMTGLELIAKIKETKPFLPSIIMSAHSDAKYIIEALHLGAVTYLSKPLNKLELKKWVGRVSFLLHEERVRGLLFGKFTSESHTATITTKQLMEGETLMILSRYMSERFMVGEALERTARLKLDLAVHEALRNAVEHGNLELDSSLKPDVLGDDGNLYHEKLVERLNNSKYADRVVCLEYSRVHDKCELSITDEGKGYDVNAVKTQFSEDDPLCHGRGFILIMSGVDSVSHNKKGNKTTLVCNAKSK